ncbi:MAG: ABC transporter permease [Lachnospiraceae bacterium]|jgi:teichoic acid transport system permease protein|nr:ABC transporter permease [Lachnospiraceae bacterium]
MKKFVNDLIKYHHVTVYMAKSELKTEVAGSYLGWLWWILDPTLYMFVYGFIALIVFRASEPYFVSFVFIGLNVWNFFSHTVQASVKLVQQNSHIVSKVYIPKFCLILYKIYVNGFKLLITVSLVLVTMIAYKVHITPRVLYVIPSLLLLAIITFGISCILMHFGVYVEDLSNIVKVLLQLAFYISGIFFSLVKRVPAPYGQLLCTINPVAFIIDTIRKVALYATNPGWKVMILWFVISGILCVIGVKLLYKFENSYVKII